MQNIGRETVDLSSIHFTDPRFSFADASKKTLAPGGFLVIVNDVAAFEERYGTEGIQVAGEFAGSLSNLRDDIIALNALEQPVIRFQYIGSWQPLAREGHSLVLQDPTAPVEAMGLEESWVPSAEVMGSPGRADGASVSTSGRRIVADLNSDGRLNIVDVLGLIEHIFRNPQPLPCESPEANRVLLDFDGDGSVSIVDPIRALGFLFRDEAPPALGVGCRPVAGCTERCGDA